MEHLSNDHEDHTNHHKNSHKLCDDMSSCFEFIGESMETETTWPKFPNGEKPIVEQILASEQKQ